MRDHLLLCEERMQRLRERGSAFGVPRTVAPADWFLLGSAAVHAIAAVAQALEGGIRDAIEQVRPAHAPAESAPGSAQPEGTS